MPLIRLDIKWDAIYFDYFAIFLNYYKMLDSFLI